MTADEPTDLIPRLAVTARLGAREGDAFFSANREAWLGYVVNMWRPYFEHAGAPLPVRIYVSVGRPARDTSTGVCFPGEASDDGYPHIFIHPVIGDSTRAAGILVHQLCHAALGNRRHDAAFKRVATTVGLIGRMTRTVEGPFFRHPDGAGDCRQDRPLSAFIAAAAPQSGAAAPVEEPPPSGCLPAVRLPDACRRRMAAGRHPVMPEPEVPRLRSRDGRRLTTV
jgi:hypothetical protein